jgi:hypothetical protein
LIGLAMPRTIASSSSLLLTGIVAPNHARGAAM